jgi:hypothetical protein
VWQPLYLTSIEIQIAALCFGENFIAVPYVMDIVNLFQRNDMTISRLIKLSLLNGNSPRAARVLECFGKFQSVWGKILEIPVARERQRQRQSAYAGELHLCIS